MRRVFRFSDRGVKDRCRLVGALVLGGLMLSACAPRLPILPPLTTEQTDEWIPGKFVWIDLIAKDVDVATNFYGELFGWTFDGGDGYTRILQDGIPIAGVVPARVPDRPSEWVGNLSVADVDAGVAKVQQLGGSLDRGPIDAPNRGRIALVRDPEGARMLLIKANGGDPSDGELRVNTWFWREMWTQNPEQAKSFYTALVGYEIEDLPGGERAYAVFKGGGRLRAGIVHAPTEVSPLWLPYVRVEDAVAVADRAEALGARVVMEHEKSAILVDPGGAPFGIQVWTGTSDRSVEEAR
jgi:predicted enzyme related to lactoylglutathione lyase